MAGATQTNVDAAGGTIRPLQSFVRLDGNPWAVVGSPVDGHGLPPHAAPVMAEGTPWIRIDGIPVCRAGHAATCGHPASGRGWIRVNG
ncbi:MAG: PAAR domain-containing protein [Magnetococcales bacterium]|nr:PAAR domain-containing protein [Magnetococcales bacterium]